MASQAIALDLVARQVRETAESIREHRAAGNYTTMHHDGPFDRSQ